MQDLNKVNQMFDKMFLGSNAGGNHTARRKSDDANKAHLSVKHLSGAMAGKDRDTACKEQYSAKH